MPIAEMKKVKIIFYKEHKEKVLDVLQRLGAVEIEEVSTREETGATTDIENKLADMKFALDFLSRYDVRSKEFWESIYGEKHYLSFEEFEERIRKIAFGKLAGNARELEREIAETKSRIAQLEAEYKALEPWKGKGVLLEVLWRGTDRLEGFVGTIPAQDFESFKKEVEAATKYAALVEADVPQNQPRLFALVYLKEEAGKVQDVIKRFTITPVSLPQRKGTPEEAQEEILKEIEEKRKWLAELEKDAQELARKIEDVQLAFDYLSIQRDKEEAAKRLFETEKTGLIVGWAKKKDVGRIKKVLEGVAREVEVIVEDPKEGEEPPVALENRRYFTKVYEPVVWLYGFPKYGTVDPVPWLAPFFFVFFGMCLGDMGYGIVLALLMFWMASHAPADAEGTKRFLHMLGVSAIAAIGVGIAANSWFGNLPEVLHIGFIARIKEKLMITDPLKDPMPFLGLSLALGVVHLFLGMFLNFFMVAKERGFVEALFDTGNWIVFLFGLVLLAVGVGRFPVLIRAGEYIAIVGAALIVVGVMRKEKNPILGFFRGLLALYGVTGYLGDVLSYARLLALGLSTSAIALVVNIMASLMAGVKIVGPIIFVIFMLIGHIFNLAISTLGAFVHTLRLQYVEFFSKFYQPGGREFSPFGIRTRFVIFRT